jgi:two-component system, cell cycle sensor histidine kinase and response regulator CckA
MTAEPSGQWPPSPPPDDVLSRISSLFKAVYDQSPHLAGILSLEGVVLNANRTACEMIGVEAPGVVGKPFLETPWVTRSDLKPESMRAAILGASRGETVKLEVAHQVADGTLRFVDLTLKPARDDSGRPFCIIAEGLDVTAKKQAEDERRAGESMLRIVFRATPIGITFNVDRVIRSVNDSMCELTGYSEQELIGQSARLFYHNDEEFQRVGREMYGELAERGRISVETYFRRKDGADLVVILTAAMLDPTNRSAGYVVTVQDITERKRAEEALRESENRLRDMLEQSPFSIQVLSSRGDVIEVNEAFEKLWGVTRESLKGYNILKDRQIESLGFMPDVQRAFAGERIQTPIVEYDVAATLGSGRRIVVQGVFYPILDANGNTREVILVHLDLTARLRAEEENSKLQEQLQQAMKMEAVGRLAGGIAHDFNNLLTAIAGNAELARMEARLPDPVAEYLDEISAAAESAATLTRQLLAFSRRQLIEPRVVNLNDLVERMRKMLARLIGEDVTLETALSKDLDSIRIDPGQFEQVLANLAVNARDAMPEGGRLIIETANVELDDDYCSRHPPVQPGAYVRLSVSDTGQGMSNEVKQRIFEPFFTTKPQGRGTGLGLATIFGIVKQAGGSIEAYSEVGMGTSFKICLPRIDMQAERLAETKHPGLERGGETILLAEDNPGVLVLSQTLLRRLGYTVLVASNGADAIQVAEQHGGRIDLLLTDVVMPGMNGRELAGRLRALHPEMKVLFTSGYVEDVIVHNGVLEENLQFIGKPYTQQKLSKKIREVLDAPAAPA